MDDYSKKYLNKELIFYQPKELLNKDKAFDWLIDCKGEKRAYQHYTENGYFEKVNNGLRYGIPVEHEVADIIQKIDKIFETMPNQYCVKSPEQVYRGISAEYLPKELENIITLKDITKNTFTDKAFVSTTTNKQIAKRFKDNEGYILNITLPAGTKRLHAKDFGAKLNEDEITLPRNCKFRVDSYDQKTRTAYITCLGQERPLPNVREIAPETRSYDDELSIKANINKINLNNK